MLKVKICEMKKISFGKKRHGFTLIEVIVSLALLMIILLLASSLFQTGKKVFLVGTSRADLQYDVRMAADFITNEVRNADDISLVEPAVDPDTYDQITVLNKRIQFTPKHETTPINKTKDVIEKLELRLIPENGRQYLAVSITGSDEKQSIELDTKVLLNNIGTQITSTTSYAVFYKKD